jgi:hypothetical protein
MHVVGVVTQIRNRTPGQCRDRVEAIPNCMVCLGTISGVPHLRGKHDLTRHYDVVGIVFDLQFEPTHYWSACIVTFPTKDIGWVVIHPV